MCAGLVRQVKNSNIDSPISKYFELIESLSGFDSVS